MDAMRKDVLALASKVMAIDAGAHAAQLADLKSKLASLEHDISVRRVQTEILRSLYVPVLQKRFNEIQEADYKSEDWLFNNPWISFTEWLRSSETVDKLFCITGRLIYPI